MERKELVITCPHCKDLIIIEKLNCGVFRHGVYKQNGKQIPQHLNKTLCDELASSNMIYGCGKPFHFDELDIVSICEYI